MMNTGIASYRGMTTGRTTRFREYHVIATLPHMRKAFDFDQARQLFVGNGNYARHAHTLS